MIKPKVCEGGISEIIEMFGWNEIETGPVYTFDGIFSKLKNMQTEENLTEDAEFEVIEPKRIENK